MYKIERRKRNRARYRHHKLIKACIKAGTIWPDIQIKSRTLKIHSYRFNVKRHW